MIITDSVSTLTIVNNRNLAQQNRRQMRNALVFIGSNQSPQSLYLRSNMGNQKEIFLTFIDNQVQLTENYSSSQLRDDNISIEKYNGSPELENLVALRKVYSNNYLCMDQDGIVLSQELQSLSDKACIWYMKKSAFGVEFYNFYHPQTHNEHWYLGTCYIKSYFPCRIINEKQNNEMSPYWFIFSTNQLSSQINLPQSLPWNPTEFFPSIKQSINKESYFFCDQMMRNLTSIALFDIKQSFNVIKKFKIGLNYLRWFLLSKLFPRKQVDMIMKLTKSIVIFYCYKKRKKLFRYFECSINHFKYCTTFRNKQGKSIYRRHFISKANQKLIQLLIPHVRLSYSEKVKWLKTKNFIEFFRKVMRIDIPKKNEIVMAAYFLQNFFDNIDIFNYTEQSIKNEEYYENIFLKKFQEIFYGLTLSMSGDNVNKLKNIRSKVLLLGQNNVCYLSTVEKLVKNIK